MFTFDQKCTYGMEVVLPDSASSGETQMWRAVAVTAILDANRAVSAAGDEAAMSNEADYQMRYFRSEDWKIVADLAGIPYSLAAVRRFIGEPRVKTAFYDIFAQLVEGRERGAVK